MWTAVGATEHAEAIGGSVLHEPGIFETILVGLSESILVVHHVLLFSVSWVVLYVDPAIEVEQ